MGRGQRWERGESRLGCPGLGDRLSVPSFFTGFLCSSPWELSRASSMLLALRSSPFVAGMHQALSGPLNSPISSREPCHLGSRFGNWSECFDVTTSQHLLKTQTFLFFLTEFLFGFRILPRVSLQSCLSFPIPVPTTKSQALSLLGRGGGFPVCPPLFSPSSVLPPPCEHPGSPGGWQSVKACPVSKLPSVSHCMQRTPWSP